MSLYHCSYCGETGHNRRTCPQRFENNITMREPRVNLEPFFEDAANEVDGMLNINIPPDTPVSTSIPIIQEPIETNTCCPICMEDLTTQPKTELMCHHSFCTKCIMTNIEHGNLKCPMCRDKVMDPSRKIKELEERISEQHNELCDQDDIINEQEEKIAKYELSSEQQYQQFTKILKENDEQMNSLINKFGFTYRHNFNNFVDSIHCEYKKYINTIKEYDVTITEPKLSKLILSIFETRPDFSNITSITNKKYYTDGEGKILTHDTWVKVVSGLYRNHMARLIWKPETHYTPGYFVARVYTGLGKPKLGQNIYDCSYTEDIKLWMLPETNNSNCIISKFMIKKIPDNSIHFAIEGNGVILPKEIRNLLKQNKITLVLNRTHTKKTGGVTILEKKTNKKTKLDSKCESINIPKPSIKPVVTTIQVDTPSQQSEIR